MMSLTSLKPIQALPMASRTVSKVSHGAYEAIRTQSLPSDLAYLQSPHPDPTHILQ